MKKNLMLNFGLILILAACGKSPKVDDDEIEYEEEPSGTFTAILFPVNEKIAPEIAGRAKVTKLGDQFDVAVQLSKSSGGSHPQFLQSGKECPLMSADVNRDGYLDYMEVQKIVGFKVVPFDDDLSSQIAGNHLFPSGNYRYKKTTSYSLLLSDLKQPDDVQNDSIIKLESRELPLDGRVVVIYGRPKGLPTSLAQSEIPIACGVLSKTSSYPDPDEWENEGDDDTVRRPRPRPKPPEPEPPQPPPKPPDPPTWWERMWERWNRWRERWSDWWG